MVTSATLLVLHSDRWLVASRFNRRDIDFTSAKGLSRSNLVNFEEPYRTAKGPTHTTQALHILACHWNLEHTGQKEPLPTQITPDSKRHSGVAATEKVLGAG